MNATQTQTHEEQEISALQLQFLKVLLSWLESTEKRLKKSRKRINLPQEAALTMVWSFIDQYRNAHINRLFYELLEIKPYLETLIPHRNSPYHAKSRATLSVILSTAQGHLISEIKAGRFPL